MAVSFLFCLIVGIADGDTLTARCDTPRGAQWLTVRLAEVDAPEKAQPHGLRSRRALSSLCLRKSARIAALSTDRHGRTVARVSCAGQDAGTAQVRAGLAWVDDRHVNDRSLYVLQGQARAARRGLWAERRPTPPWDWRARHTSR